jgi:flagellar biosynthesis protein FlhF
MEVRKFEGITMSDAMKAVKKELGKDAVILTTKERTIEGGRSKIYEVRATSPSAKIETQSHEGFKNDALKGQVTLLETRLNGLIEKVPTHDDMHRLESGLSEVKMLLLEALRKKDGGVLENLSEDLASIYHQLSVMGVEETHCGALINFLNSLPKDDMKSLKTAPERLDFYRSNAIRWMLKRIKVAPKWSLSQGSTCVHAFVGNSGSGKSTAIAKLAAMAKKDSDASVLLVSADNQKVGAGDQLRLMSKLLGVNYAAIDTLKDLKSLVLENRDAQLILVDTAGANPRNETQIAELKEFNRLGFPVDVHLVLPLTEKQVQLDRSVRSFSSIGIASLIFSRMDECWTYGDVYNISQKWSLPLSYFSTGQNVPGSMERASRERVIERIFSL